MNEEEAYQLHALCVELILYFILFVTGSSQDPQLGDVNIQFHASSFVLLSWGLGK
jgi:hypothetical protein